MRDRDQRLHWIEKLIGASYQGEDRRNALVIPTAIGDMAIEFPAIVEVLPGARVQPLAFLPEDFCGVVLHGNALVPVIDTEGTTGAAAHVVLTEGAGCLIGLRFYGTPLVVDLNETEHVAIQAQRMPHLRCDKLPLLSIDEVVVALLNKDLWMP